MPKWNRPATAAHLGARDVSPAEAYRLVAVALGSLALALNQSTLLAVVGAAAPGGAAQALALACLRALCFLVAAAAGALGCRALAGMHGAGKAPAPAAAAPAPQAAGSPFNLQHAPLREGRVHALPPDALRAPPTPSSDRSHGRPSPAGRRVATPEQLRRVLDDYDQGTGLGTPLDGGGGGRGAASPYGAAAAGAGFSAAAAAAPLQLGPGPAPVYQPSAVPRGMGALPARAGGGGRPAPSSLEAKRAVMERLGVSQRTLEAGTERLREWLAGVVVQPLVRALATAHGDVAAAAARLGYPPISLAPLDQAPHEDGSRRSGRLAEGGSMKRADDEATVLRLRGDLEGRARAAAGLPHAPPGLAECLRAVARYQALAALLRGESPPALLPPAPNGYVAARLRELGEGSCLAAFAWDAGGAWAGREWRADLPTDSALVAYVFAAFLGAPHWEPPLAAAGAGGGAGPGAAPGAPLYLGKLPPRLPQGAEYHAVLSTLPPPSHAATALLALQAGTRDPRFTLLARGEPLLELTGQSALLHGALLFLHCCRGAGGALGGASLELLGLEPVLERARPSTLSLGAMRLAKLFSW